MPKAVTQQVVEMSFENSQFERGIDQSTKSIDKLKTSLDFSGVTSNIDGIGSAVDSITGKLSPFGEAWRRIWSNVGDIAFSTIASIENAMSSMGFEQVIAGFEKYTLLSKSTQTIMAATRKEWDDQHAQMEYVNDQLEKLNWFTDETSYNFTDMAGNIAKFTSSGVALDTAVTSMMGIATWGGISGASIEEVSRAMYNLSQAMSMGYIQVKDWASIETANMATVEFKQTVIDTAVELGTLNRRADGTVYAIKKTKKGIEYLDVTVDNFRSTMGKDYGYWFTSDVLLGALNKYGGFAEQLYKYVESMHTSATELLGQTKEYKKTLEDVKKTADELGEEDTEKIKNYIDLYTRGTLDLEKVAEEYGITVDELAEHFNKYKGSLLDLNHLKSITTGTLAGAMDLKSALDSLSSSEYELGYAAMLASQESRTFQDSFIATQDALSSTWMRVFKTVLGDYLESVELWSAVTEEMWYVFVQGVDDLYWVIKDWGDLGGREILLEGIQNSWETIKQIIDFVKMGLEDVFPMLTGEELIDLTTKFRDFTETLGLNNLQLFHIRNSVKFVGETVKNIWGTITKLFSTVIDAFNEIFPKTQTTEKTVYNLTKGLKNLSEKLVLSDEKAEKFKRVFKGIFAIFDILKQLFIAILKPILGATSGMDSLADKVLDVSAGFGDWLVNLDEYIKENDIFGKAIEKIIEFVNILREEIDKLLVSLTGKDLAGIWELIKNNASDAVKDIKDFFASFGTKDSQNAEKSTEKIAGFFDAIKNGFNKLKEGWEKFKPYLDDFIDAMGESFEVDLKNWDDIKGMLTDFGALGVIFIVAQMLWDAYDFLSWFLWDTPLMIKNFADSVTLILEGLGESLWNFSLRIKAGIITKIARAVLYLAIAMALIASIRKDKLEDAVVVMAGMFGALAGTLEVLQNTTSGFDTQKIWAIGRTLRAIGIAMLLVGASIAIIGKVSAEGGNIKEAGEILGGLLVVMAGFVYIMSQVKVDANKIKTISGCLIVIGIALILFAAAISILVAINNDSLKVAVAVAALSAIMAVIVGLMNQVNNIKVTKVVTVAGALVVIGIALILIAASIAILVKINDDSMKVAVAVGALAVMLIAIAALCKAMPNNLPLIAMGLILVGIALVLIANAISLVASAKIENITKGLEAMLITLTAVGILLAALSKLNGNVMLGAAALLVASVGLIAIAYALTILSQIHSLDGVIVLAAALLVLMVAAFVAEKVAGGLFAIGVAIALIGAGAFLAGMGVLKFAEGISILVAQGTEGVDVMIYALESIGHLIPGFAAKLAEGLGVFAASLLDSGAVILDAVVLILTIILKAIITCLPLILDIIAMLFDGLVDFIIKVTPVIVKLTVFITEQILQGLMTLTPEITAAALFILKDTLTQLAENIEEITYLLTDIALKITFGFLAALNDHIPDFIQTGVDLILAILEGLALAIDNNTDRFVATMRHLGESLINAFCKVLGINSPSTEFFDAAQNCIAGLLNGFNFTESVEKVKAAVQGFIDKIIEPIKDVVDTVYNIGKDVVQGFLKGIQEFIDDPGAAITNMANGMVNATKTIFDINSPSRVFRSIGHSVDEGLALGIDDYTDEVIDSSMNVGYAAIDSVSSVISNISDMINNDIDTEPTIRPVMDLTGINEGIGTIDDMLNDNQTLNMAGLTSNSVNQSLLNKDYMRNAVDDLRMTLNGVVKDQNGTVNNYTFNVTGDNPREIANEISRIIQTQVERRGAAWV